MLINTACGLMAVAELASFFRLTNPVQSDEIPCKGREAPPRYLNCLLSDNSSHLPSDLSDCLDATKYTQLLRPLQSPWQPRYGLGLADDGLNQESAPKCRSIAAMLDDYSSKTLSFAHVYWPIPEKGGAGVRALDGMRQHTIIPGVDYSHTVIMLVTA